MPWFGSPNVLCLMEVWRRRFHKRIWIRTSIPRTDGNPIRMAVGVFFACGSCRGRGHGQNEIERCCWCYHSRLDLVTLPAPHIFCGLNLCHQSVLQKNRWLLDSISLKPPSPCPAVSACFVVSPCRRSAMILLFFKASRSSWSL